MSQGDEKHNVSDVDKENIAPFLTILVLRRNHGADFSKIHSDIVSEVSKASKDEIYFGETKSLDYREGLGFSHTTYNLYSTPAWLVNSSDKDLERNIIVSLYSGDHIALYFSQKGLKDQVRELIEDGDIKDLEFVDSSIFNFVFVNEDKVNMLWLSGIHGKEASKADSKVLGGGGVVDTLDPILDQSYVMSAARTEVDFDSVGVSIGINPFKSSVWRGPCNSWEQFESRVFKILDTVETCKGTKDNPVSFLSYPINDCNGLSGPYDFSIADPDFLPSDFSQQRANLLRRIWGGYNFELQVPLHGNYVWLDVFSEGKKVGDVKFDVRTKKNKAFFEFKSKNPIAGCKLKFDDFLKILSYPELVKIWFESGHAVVNGMVYKTGYVDVEYDGFIWSDFSNFNIKQEKPGRFPSNPELHKTGSYRSLFCWVFREWTGCWHTPSDYGKNNIGKGWLYCDDGAGEKADFIHYIEWEGIHYISLIHVKAAKSDSPNRKISVGAHDVVLSQAVKNIRYCYRKNLIGELSNRAKNATEKHCWLDGKRKTSAQFIQKLEKLPNNGTVKTRVLVVQPHTFKNYYNAASTNIRNQLDVLLVSAQNSVRSAGSSFYIIGAE